MNRQYMYQAAWRAEPWLYSDSSEACYQCPLAQLRQDVYKGVYRDYKDAKGNIINKALDESDCSVAKGCPAGYTATSSNSYVCEQTYNFVPVEHVTKGAWVHDGGHIGNVYAKSVTFDGGYATMVGKCWRWVGGNGTASVMPPAPRCSDYGGPAAFCAACDGKTSCGSCVADDSEYDLSTFTAKQNAINREQQHEAGVGMSSEKVPMSCCERGNLSDGQYSLSSGPWADGKCKQPRLKHTFSFHYFECQQKQ